MRAKGFGQIGLALLLFTVLTAGSASAYDPYDPHNCNGLEWDNKRALVVRKVTAKPRVNFIKSPYDDEFKAETCPAATEACRRKSYLVTGDLVLVGKTQSEFTCVAYQSPLAKKQILDHRLAAERGADASRADAVAEDVGLDRHLAASGRQHRDQERRRGQFAS
jgi:hypothetical protein